MEAAPLLLQAMHLARSRAHAAQVLAALLAFGRANPGVALSGAVLTTVLLVAARPSGRSNRQRLLSPGLARPQSV